MTPETRYYLQITKTLNPFNDVNFNKAQLDFAETDKLDNYREIPLPNTTIPTSIARAIYGRRPFKPLIEE